MVRNDDSRRRHRRTDTRSRRSVLAAGATCIGTAVAGCSSITGSGPSGNSPSGNGVFQNIGFEGQQMVIDLADGHSVKRVNLIGPDGSRYGSSSVATGETRTSIEILRITSGRWFHYPVGESRLIAVGPDSDVEKTIQLTPTLTLNSVSQYEGDQNRTNGNLEFTVKNTGTAPTWIYRIFYEGVPNKEAEDRTANKGEPTLVLNQPSSDEGAIIQPDESQTVVGHSPPLQFEGDYECNGETIEGVATVDSPVDARARSRFEATLSGKRHSQGESGFSKQYACGDLSVQLLTGGDSSA